jgi:hypothetical protein
MKIQQTEPRQVLGVPEIKYNMSFFALQAPGDMILCILEVRHSPGFRNKKSLERNRGFSL